MIAKRTITIENNNGALYIPIFYPFNSLKNHVSGIFCEAENKKRHFLYMKYPFSNPVLGLMMIVTEPATH